MCIWLYNFFKCWWWIQVRGYFLGGHLVTVLTTWCNHSVPTYVWGRGQRDFYNSSQAETEIIPSHDVGIVQENFKARVINKNEERQRTMGKEGVVDMTEYDCRLYGFSVKMYFLVKGTILEQKKIKSDREVIWCTHTHNQIDQLSHFQTLESHVANILKLVDAKTGNQRFDMTWVNLHFNLPRKTNFSALTI